MMPVIPKEELPPLIILINETKSFVYMIVEKEKKFRPRSLGGAGINTDLQPLGNALWIVCQFFCLFRLCYKNL